MRYRKAADVMLSKAEQKFKLAEISFASELYDTCVSALYYSAFQYVTALILARGEKVSNKHTYVRGWENNTKRPGCSDVWYRLVYFSSSIVIVSKFTLHFALII